MAVVPVRDAGGDKFALAAAERRRAAEEHFGQFAKWLGGLWTVVEQINDAGQLLVVELDVGHARILMRQIEIATSIAKP